MAALAGGERAPDETVRVAVPGGQVTAYIYGNGPETVLLVNGGPGIASRGIRRDHGFLVDLGYRVVAHDQLGTGASDRPDDMALWTLSRYVAEVEAVRVALDLGPVHLLGNSWGGWLGCDYVCTHPQGMKSFIAANTGADMDFHMAELRRLIGAFGDETLRMVDRHEAEGTLDDPEYRAFCTLFYTRHQERRPSGRRRQPAAEPAAEPRELNMAIQIGLWGPAEFTCIGDLAGLSRLDDLRRFDRPCLVFNGAYDYITAREGAMIHQAVRGSEMFVFAASGHKPVRDEPESYRDLVGDFLARAR